MTIARFFLLATLLIGCQSDDEKLPVLSYTINAAGNKETHSITYSDFRDQNGKAISNKTLDHKIVVANFFFTRCPSICPPMRMRLIELANEFKDTEAVLIISHSIDPKNDTTEVLKRYAEATEIDNSKWLFIRSTEENTKQQAKQYMTNFKPNEDGTDFYHSSYVALLDKDQLIRGFYNILIPEEVARLKQAIKTLL